MANGKNDEYPDDWFFSPESSAVEALDTIGVNTGAVGALNLIGGGEGTVPPAYQRSFGFDEQMGRGMDYVADAAEDVSQETVDKIIPGIAIGAGEAVRKVAKRDWRWPKGVGPKIRATGKAGVAYTLALDASQLVQEKAREYASKYNYEPKKIPSLVVGGGAAYGGYKLATKFAFNFLDKTKVGMAAEVMESVIGDASLKVYNKVLGGVPITKSTEQLAIKAQMLAKEAGEKASNEVVEVVKERMGKHAAKEWDDITKQLLKPRIAGRVGKHLAKIAPKTATKLAISATATVIPEGFSSLLGVAGLAWTAYDIFNLMKHMPDASTLRNLLFEEIPERSAEDMLIDEMGASDSLFVPQEQKMQP